MTTQFAYTPEEITHLEALCFSLVHTEQYDAEYFRYHAELSVLDDRDRFLSHEGMHPSDVGEPTAADMLECADQVECGFIGGETL